MTRGSPSLLVERDPKIERRYVEGYENNNKINFGSKIEIEGLKEMAEENELQRTLSDNARPTAFGTQSSIVRPTAAANNFEFMPAFIQIIQQSAQFNGLSDEDPNSHIENFLKVYDMLKINGVSYDAVHLRAFPFSLKG